MSTKEKQATPKAAFVFLVPLANEQPAQQAIKRVSALTANVFAEDSERALHAGMDDHMGKPVEVPQLLATMMHWIG